MLGFPQRRKTKINPQLLKNIFINYISINDIVLSLLCRRKYIFFMTGLWSLLLFTMWYLVRLLNVYMMPTFFSFGIISHVDVFSYHSITQNLFDSTAQHCFLYLWDILQLLGFSSCFFSSSSRKTTENK